MVESHLQLSLHKKVQSLSILSQKRKDNYRYDREI